MLRNTRSKLANILFYLFITPSPTGNNRTSAEIAGEQIDVHSGTHDDDLDASIGRQEIA